MERRGLFKVSCSEFVSQGFHVTWIRSSLGALRQRIRRCRGGYRICSSKNACGLELHLCDGSVIGESEISNHLLEPYWDAQTETGSDSETNNQIAEQNSKCVIRTDEVDADNESIHSFFKSTVRDGKDIWLRVRVHSAMCVVHRTWADRPSW